MNAIAKSPFAWLLRREHWESRRGFFWAQFWGAAALLIVTILGIIAVEALRMRAGVDGADVSTGLTRLLVNAKAHDYGTVNQILGFNMLIFGGIASIIFSFVVFFYLLGALYDDRRDRSILFWKSLPVSDTTTVISKIIAALVLAPLLATGVVLAGFVVWQVIASLWLLAHGVNPLVLIWAHGAPYAVWLHFLVAIPVNAVWALPTVGWLLFWSAAVRSKPFLWAVVTPILAAVLNWWIALLGLPHIGSEFFLKNLLARPLFSVIPGTWIGSEDMQQFAARFQTHSADYTFNGAIYDYGAIAHAFARPDMWIGAAAGIVLIGVAIWFRRWRDEA